MNLLPIDPFNTICLYLGVFDLSRLIIVAKRYQQILNVEFWKKFILNNYKGYQLCADSMILEQLRYLFHFTKLERVTYHYFDFPENGKPTRECQCLSISPEFIINTNIKKGDICWFTEDENEVLKFIYDGRFLHPFDEQYAISMPSFPTRLKIIEEFPIAYWCVGADYPDFSLSFNTIPYLDQIKKNLVRTDKWEESDKQINDPEIHVSWATTIEKREVIYTTWFIHKYGKRYMIQFASSFSPSDFYPCKYFDPEKVVKFISFGAFYIRFTGTNEMFTETNEPYLYINQELIDSVTSMRSLNEASKNMLNNN